MSCFKYELSTFIPYRDTEICSKVRAIKKENITKHRNLDFKIKIFETSNDFYFQFALDMVIRISNALEENKQLVMILPVGPTPQYYLVAELINKLRIPCKHIHTFNMDEYADHDGITAPSSWKGSFQRTMKQNFFNLIDREIGIPDSQIHFPTTKNISDYGKMIQDHGGADVCYGGVGWAGHIAFWEPHLGFEFKDDIESYMKAGPRIVELHPMTIMQNALHSFSGDWSWVPPKAATIGPEQIISAKYRSFWLDGYLGGGVSWQRFIARLSAHGPITPLVPASILQKVPTSFNLLGGVAEDCAIVMK